MSLKSLVDEKNFDWKTNEDQIRKALLEMYDPTVRPFKNLIQEVKTIILKKAGLRYSFWKHWDWVNQLSMEDIKEVNEAFYQLRNSSSDRSPFYVEPDLEIEIMVKVGPKIYRKMLWQSGTHKYWNQKLLWMSRNPGFEELGPWTYLFLEKDMIGMSDLEQPVKFPPNQFQLELVRDYGHILDHPLIARCLTILGYHPQEVNSHKIVRWCFGHSSFKQGWTDPEYKSLYAEYLDILLDTFSPEFSPEFQQYWEGVLYDSYSGVGSTYTIYPFSFFKMSDLNNQGVLQSSHILRDIMEHAGFQELILRGRLSSLVGPGYLRRFKRATPKHLGRLFYKLLVDTPNPYPFHRHQLMTEVLVLYKPEPEDRFANLKEWGEAISSRVDRSNHHHMEMLNHIQEHLKIMFD